MRPAPLVLLAPFVLFAEACADERSCADEVLIAASVDVSIPVGSGLTIDQVSIEKEREELCSIISTKSERGSSYQCWEQGGAGSYVVRVYAGDSVWSRTLEFEGSGCHIRERASLSIDLADDADPE